MPDVETMDPFKIHLNCSDHETSDSGNSDFDEEYYKFQPPPIAILPQNVIMVEASRNSRKNSSNVKILKIAQTNYDDYQNATYSVTVKKKGGKSNASDIKKKKTTVLINKGITGKQGLTTKKNAVKNAVMIEASKKLQKNGRNVKIAQTRYDVQSNAISSVTVKNKVEKKDDSDIAGKRKKTVLLNKEITGKHGLTTKKKVSVTVKNKVEKKDASDIAGKRKQTVLINKEITGKHGLTTKKKVVKNGLMIKSPKNSQKNGINVKIDIHQNALSTVTVKNKGEKKDASALRKRKFTVLTKKEITGNHGSNSWNKSPKKKGEKKAIAPRENIKPDKNAITKKAGIITKNQFDIFESREEENIWMITKYSDIVKKGTNKFKAETDLLQERKNRNTNSEMISSIHDEADDKILQNYTHWSINELDDISMAKKKKQNKKTKNKPIPKGPIKCDRKVKDKNKKSITTASEKPNTTYSYYKYSNSNFEIYNGPLIGEISDNHNHEQQKTLKPKPIHNLFYPEFKKDYNQSNHQKSFNDPENSNELFTVSKPLDNLLGEIPGHSSVFNNDTKKTSWPVVELKDSLIDSHPAYFDGTLMGDEEYRTIQNKAESWRLGFAELIPNDHWANLELLEYPGKSDDLFTISKPLENNFSRTISTEKTAGKSKINKQKKKELISNEDEYTITSYFGFPNENVIIQDETEFSTSQNSRDQSIIITNIEKNIQTMHQKTQEDYQRVSSPIIHEPGQNGNLSCTESIQNNYWSNNKMPKIDEELITETSLTNLISGEPGHISVPDDTNWFRSTTNETSTNKLKKKKQKKNKNEENCPLVELRDLHMRDEDANRTLMTQCDPHFEISDGSQIKYTCFDGSLMQDVDYRFIQNEAESWRLGFAESIPNDHWTNQELLEYPGKTNDLFTISKPLENIYSRTISTAKPTSKSERNKQKKNELISDEDKDTRTSTTQSDSYFGFPNEEGAIIQDEKAFWSSQNSGDLLLLENVQTMEQKPQENYKRVSSSTILEPEPNSNPCFAESIQNNYWSNDILHRIDEELITETSLTNHLSGEPGYISILDDINFPRSTIIKTTRKKSKKKKQKKSTKQIIFNEEICPLVELGDPHFENLGGSQIAYKEEDLCVNPNNNMKHPCMTKTDSYFGLPNEEDAIIQDEKEIWSSQNSRYQFLLGNIQTMEQKTREDHQRLSSPIIHEPTPNGNSCFAESIQNNNGSNHKLPRFDEKLITETSLTNHLSEEAGHISVLDDTNYPRSTNIETTMKKSKKKKQKKNMKQIINKDICPLVEKEKCIQHDATLWFNHSFTDSCVAPNSNSKNPSTLELRELTNSNYGFDMAETTQEISHHNMESKINDLVNHGNELYSHVDHAELVQTYLSKHKLYEYLRSSCEVVTETYSFNGVCNSPLLETQNQFHVDDDINCFTTSTTLTTMTEPQKKRKPRKNRKNKSRNQAVILPNMEDDDTNRSLMGQYVGTSERTLPHHKNNFELLMKGITIKDEQQEVAVMQKQPEFEYEQTENLLMNQQLTSVGSIADGSETANNKPRKKKKQIENRKNKSRDPTVILPNMEENDTNRSSMSSSMEQYVVTSEGITLTNYTDNFEPLMNGLTVKDEQQEITVMPEFEYEVSENLQMNQQQTSVGSIADGSETANNKPRKKKKQTKNRRNNSRDPTVILPNMEENDTNRSSMTSSMEQYVVTSEGITGTNYTDNFEPLMNGLTVKDEQQEITVMPEYVYEKSENLQMNQQQTSVGSIADGSETTNNKSQNKHTHYFTPPKRRSIFRRCLNSVSKIQLTIMGGCFVWMIYLFKKK